MKFKTILLFFLVGVLFSNCKKDDDTTPTVQIIPGEGITGIEIGGSAQQAIDLYGNVADSYFASGNQYVHFLIYFSKGVYVYCEPSDSEEFSPTLKVAYLRVTEPFEGKTDKGIGIGSTKTEVEAAYGQPISSSMFFGDEFSNGLVIIYNDGGTLVEEIEIN